MKLVRRLRYLWNSRQRQSQLGDELEEHIALHIDELMNQGMNRTDAELQARRRIGNSVRIKEQSREVWVTRWIDDLVQDLRGGIRLLARNRTYALVAVSTLALGIGSNTAVFTMVNDVLLKPLPYTDSDRLVVVWERNSQAGKDRYPGAPPNLEDWVSGADRFEGLAAYRYESFALTGTGEAEQLTTLAWKLVGRLTTRTLRIDWTTPGPTLPLRFNQITSKGSRGSQPSISVFSIPP
jgi:hypothetical protein